MFTPMDLCRGLCEVELTLKGVGISIVEAESEDEWKNIYLTLSAIRVRLDELSRLAFYIKED